VSGKKGDLYVWSSNSVGPYPSFLYHVFEARGIDLMRASTHQHRIRSANCEEVPDVRC
jgi:hypothetical protein